MFNTLTNNYRQNVIQLLKTDRDNFMIKQLLASIMKKKKKEKKQQALKNRLDFAMSQNAGHKTGHNHE